MLALKHLRMDSDFREFISMVEKSIRFYALAIGIFLISLFIEGFAEMRIEGFILVAIALNLFAVYSSITKASFELWWIHTSLAYVCSILSVVTFFLPVASWALIQAVIWIEPRLLILWTLVVYLHVLGGLIAVYSGRCARDEWSEYWMRVEEESRPKNPGLAIN